MPQVDVKLVLDESPTREDIKKATMLLKVDKSPGIDCIAAEVYQCGGEAVLISFRICSATDGRKELPQDLGGCSHCLSVQKQGREIRLFKLSRHYSTLHCRQNLGWRLAE